MKNKKEAENYINVNICPDPRKCEYRALLNGRFLIGHLCLYDGVSIDPIVYAIIENLKGAGINENSLIRIKSEKIPGNGIVNNPARSTLEKGQLEAIVKKLNIERPDLSFEL